MRARSLFDESGTPSPAAPARGETAPEPQGRDGGLQEPLAVRMRPRSLDEVVGQAHLVGPDSPLRKALRSGVLPSLVLWGPPGCGKTTIARLLAEASGALFVALSAVEAGIADLRAAVTQARGAKAQGRRTVLFVDELHRWSRAQQDAALPHVESGLLTLIGATTENPSFEVNAALLSRTRVYRLHPLTDEEILQLVRAALADGERGLGAWGVELAPEGAAALAAVAGGDGRVALSTLELAAAVTAPDAQGRRLLTAAAVEAAADRRVPWHDRAGEQHYDTISAFIKSVRGSDPDAAVFWLARMLEAGEDPVFVARRLLILAAEDIGLADPQALGVAVAAFQAAHFVGMPEGYLPLAEATLYLALAPKSNAVLRAYAAAAEDSRQHPAVQVPLHLRNAVTGLMRHHGYGVGYRYAHDAPDGVAAQQHLPEGLQDRRYYAPTDRGAEAELRQRLQSLRQRLRVPG